MAFARLHMKNNNLLVLDHRESIKHKREGTGHLNISVIVPMMLNDQTTNHLSRPTIGSMCLKNS